VKGNDRRIVKEEANIGESRQGLKFRVRVKCRSCSCLASGIVGVGGKEEKKK
jgi:hypothetical protein